MSDNTPWECFPAPAPAVPQGWKVERKSDYRIRVESPSGDAWSFEHVDDRGSANLFVYQMLDAMLAAPSQERCQTCGYLTSEREHLGCLRKAVKDLDAATGGPYPSQPVRGVPDVATWLWIRFADYCRKQGMNPHHQNDLFVIVNELRAMLASTTPPVQAASQPVTLTDGEIEQLAVDSDIVFRCGEKLLTPFLEHIDLRQNVHAFANAVIAALREKEQS